MEQIESNLRVRLEEVACGGAVHGVARDDQRVVPALRPQVQELARQPALPGGGGWRWGGEG